MSCRQAEQAFYCWHYHQFFFCSNTLPFFSPVSGCSSYIFADKKLLREEIFFLIIELSVCLSVAWLCINYKHFLRLHVTWPWFTKMNNIIELSLILVHHREAFLVRQGTDVDYATHLFSLTSFDIIVDHLEHFGSRSPFFDFLGIILFVVSFHLLGSVMLSFRRLLLCTLLISSLVTHRKYCLNNLTNLEQN